MPHPHQVSAGIFTSPHQIANRLDLTLGNGYRGDLTQPQQPGQMRRISCVGLDPVPSWALQLRRRSDHAFHPGLIDRARQPEPGRARLIRHPHRGPQLMKHPQDFPIIRAQPRPSDLACFLVNGVRNHRKRMHVQPDTRTLNNHRRPPDLQMWLCQRECSPTPTTHESFCSTRPSASASPHTVYSCGGGKLYAGPEKSCEATTSRVPMLQLFEKRPTEGRGLWARLAEKSV